MSARKWLFRLVILAALSAILGSALGGCQSAGGYSGGGDGHAGHSH